MAERHPRLDRASPCPGTVFHLLVSFHPVPFIRCRINFLIFYMFCKWYALGLFVNAGIQLDGTYRRTGSVFGMHVDRTVDGRRAIQYRSRAFEHVYLFHIIHRNQVPGRTAGIGTQHRHIVQQQHHTAAHTGTEPAAAAHLRLVIHNGQTRHALERPVQGIHIVFGNAFQSHHFHGLYGSLAVAFQTGSLYLHRFQGRGERGQPHVENLRVLAFGKRNLYRLFFITQIAEIQLHLGTFHRQHIIPVHIGHRTLPGSSHHHYLCLRQYQLVFLVVNPPFYHTVVLGL